MSLYGTITLIVVCKDEMYINQLRKLVEAKDDSDSSITGTQDGSIQIVAWDEKTWLAQKKAGNISNKVLFIGDVKGLNKLLPIIDIQFNEYGVKYGWAGNQAAIWIEPQAISDEEIYVEFLKKLNELPIPKQYRVEIPESTKVSASVAVGKQNLWNQLAVLGVNAFLTVKDLLKDKTQVKNQMFF
jgi:hypothetical protein